MGIPYIQDRNKHEMLLETWLRLVMFMDLNI